MGSSLGALVLYASDVDETVAFYRLLGLDLQVDDHGIDAGPVHYACDLDGCHFAIFPADEPGRAPGRAEGGATFVGLAVESVEAAVASARVFGATVLQQPESYPWGLRAVVEDPDGRPVEVFTPPD